MREGRMQKLFLENGIAFDESAGFDPYELMPKWLQPRKSA